MLWFLSLRFWDRVIFCSTLNYLTCFVTFNQPLYIKALCQNSNLLSALEGSEIFILQCNAMFLQTSTRSTPDNSSSSIIRNESEDIKKHEQIHFRHLLDSTNKWRFAFLDRIKCKTFFKLFLIKSEITCTILPPASQVRCIQKLT
jgi:hypothetical protein